MATTNDLAYSDETVQEPFVYLNGQMLPASQAHLAIYDAGAVLGATVTDQARTFRRRLYRLDDHLHRLFRSLHVTGMEIGISREQLSAVAHDLVANNGRLIDEENDLGIVVFVTAGEYRSYAGTAGRTPRTEPTVCVHTFPLPFELWAEKVQKGVHLVTPSVRHVPPQCIDPNVKHRSRMHFYLADQEARRTDPEAAALLLDLNGTVTETSTANFLMVERGRIVSPTLANTLPGVSRATVVELASKMGIAFVERDIQPAEIAGADEAFLASTPYCLMPATKINGTAIGNGKPGPMFRRLIAAWSQEVGLDIDRQIIEGAKRRQAKVAST